MKKGIKVIQKFAHPVLSVMVLISFLAMYVQPVTVWVVEIEGHSYKGEPFEYMLPNGEKINLSEGEKKTFCDVEVTIRVPVMYIYDLGMLVVPAALKHPVPSEQKTVLEIRKVDEFKKEQAFFLLAIGSLKIKEKKPLVLLTGVGIKPIEHIFKDITTGQPTHTEVTVDGKKYKANIGAATAFELCKKGLDVHMIARTEDKLKIVQQWVRENVPDARIDYSAISISDREAVDQLIQRIPEEKDVFWVQSVGLGGGTVNVKDDNPYLAIDDISPELMEAELSVLTDTVKMLQTLLPRFRSQKETRVCIVSSMSAIRSVAFGSIHNAAKGSISRFTNAAMLELDKDGIFVTDVRPGAVDTGMYDSTVVRDAVCKISATMNYDWSEENGGLRLAPPSSVGKVIAEVLSSEAHITSVNLVARGQFPHEGS